MSHRRENSNGCWLKPASAARSRKLSRRRQRGYDNRDFSESVAAVRIQQEAGGNLASLFDTLADTMVQRLRLRREVRTLTAEGRLSAYILGLMPLLLGILIFAINRPYMDVLFQTFAGKVMLLGSLVLQIVGFYWMYRIVNIET